MTKPDSIIQQKDLFGNVVEEDVLLRDKYQEPPFSILDTKSGSWQNRKRQWLRKGIKSEIGRDAKSYNMQDWLAEKPTNGAMTMSDTSIFDPVLTELMYRWFCPDAGMILDPFAGGSVRGIVANYLGFKYTGIDLREEQIKANRDQALELLPIDKQPQWYVGDSDKLLSRMGNNVPMKVKISRASMLQMFHACEPDYIRNVCHGRCCEGSHGIKVVVTDDEVDHIRSLGATVTDNFITADERGLCTFKLDEGFCKIHNLGKPFGCRASPFILTDKDTLVVRNRYRLLKCFNDEGSSPAYIAHRWSLEQIFGISGYRLIQNGMTSGEDDFIIDMPSDSYRRLKENDDHRGKEPVIDGSYDFVFSCPPYMDLEVYSDHPDDLSNMPDAAFISKYESIIMKSVERLKNNRFAAFVVGDLRDKNHMYKDFVGITKNAFVKAGMGLYNDAVLLTAIASAGMRADGNMKSRKLVRVHQNVLVFYKGDVKKIRETFPALETK